MQASHRAKGIQSKLNPEGRKQPMVKTQHDGDWQFIIALHINDLVSISLASGVRELYRIQVLDRDGGRLELRLQTASTLNNKNEHIRKSISVLMNDGLKKLSINSIGIISDDKTNN